MKKTLALVFGILLIFSCVLVSCDTGSSSETVPNEPGSNITSGTAPNLTSVIAGTGNNFTWTSKTKFGVSEPIYLKIEGTDPDKDIIKFMITTQKGNTLVGNYERNVNLIDSPFSYYNGSWAFSPAGNDWTINVYAIDAKNNKSNTLSISIIIDATIDWTPLPSEIDIRRADNESLFGMTLQNTSDNIDWYSTASNKQLLLATATVVEPKISEFVNLFGIIPSPKIEMWYYNRNDWNTAFKDKYGINIGSGYTGVALHPNIMAGTRPINVTSLTDDILIGTIIHEMVHIFQFNLRNNSNHGYDWINEGTADYLQSPKYYTWSRSMIVSEVQKNNIPTIDFLETKFRAGDGDPNNPITSMNYRWAFTIIEFIDVTWGFDNVVKLNKLNTLELKNSNTYVDYFNQIFNTSKSVFQEQWYQYLKKNYSR